jgi:hypothetical protein
LKKDHPHREEQASGWAGEPCSCHGYRSPSHGLSFGSIMQIALKAYKAMLTAGKFSYDFIPPPFTQAKN